MRSLGLAWLIFIVVFAGLLIAPVTRDVLRVEGSTLCPFASLHGLYPASAADFYEKQRSPLLRRLLAKAVAQHPGDWRILLGTGLLLEGEKESLAYLEKAVQLAPDHPETLMALSLAQMRPLTWLRKESSGYGYPLPPDFTEKLLSADQTRPARESLERLQSMEVDNAAPKALLASLKFGERRDAEAIALLKAAVSEPRLNFYHLEMLQARTRALKAARLPSFEATVMAFYEIPFHHFARLREVARILSYKAMEAKEAGRDKETIEDWMTTIRLGRVMRYQAAIFIEALVGNAIEAIGAAPAYKRHRMKQAAKEGLISVSELARTPGRFNGGDIFKGKQHDYFLKHAGATVAGDVFASLEQANKFKNLLREYLEKTNIARLLQRAVLLIAPGTVMLGQILILAAVMVLLGLIPWGKTQGSSRLHNAWTALVALIALAPAVFFWVYQALPREPSGQEYGEAFALFRSPAHRAGLFLLPALFVLLIAALLLRLRRTNTDSLGLIIIRLLRQVVPVSLILLVVAFAGIVLQTAMLRGQTTAALEAKMTGGEMAQICAEHPEFFHPPRAQQPK